jgi:pSer/pThr/pTyr-binding forkhead associated (FHA) protein
MHDDPVVYNLLFTGIFLSEACLSREHAIIFLEKGQRQGTIMDKASSNKVF